MKKKAAILASAAVAIGVVLTGCGSNSGQTTVVTEKTVTKTVAMPGQRPSEVDDVSAEYDGYSYAAEKRYVETARQFLAEGVFAPADITVDMILADVNTNGVHISRARAHGMLRAILR